MQFPRIRSRLYLLLLLCLLAVLLPSDGRLGQANRDWLVSRATGTHGFRLAAWETQAIAQKVGDVFTRPGVELSQSDQHNLVLAFLDTASQIDHLEWEIDRIYADPKNTDPRAASASQLAQLDSLRAEQSARRPAVERTIEQQLAVVLQEAGLTTVGRLWPPVRFQFTESPFILIISPRNTIRVDYDLYLDPTLAVPQMEQIEAAVQGDLDVSALVEGTGGFSSYPTMVVPIDDPEWVLSAVAHEWTHTYLIFYPLGWNYFTHNTMRTINETAASIVGDEIARLTLERYYPDRVPPPAQPADNATRPSAPPAFQFGPFMRETRLHVDELLASGRITEAEAYMEERRQVLVTQGYAIRKINQAYFAFHGSYAVGPTATDPIGGKLRTLRQRSSSLAQFVRTISGFRSLADLDSALANP